jgi:CHAT domain-containing protein
MAVIWASRCDRRRHARDRPPQADVIQQLSDAVARKDSDWRPASAAAGEALLAQLPPLSQIQHLLIVPDSPLHFVPFEALKLPGTDTLLVERFDVSYLPSAAFLVQPMVTARRWAWPWQRELVAFGDPATAASYPLETVPWPPLPYAAEEVRRVAHALPGRAEIHPGVEARKQFVTVGPSHADRHFSTHAVADTARSGPIAHLAGAAGTRRTGGLSVLRDVNDLDLTGVGLVTLSAQ